jgi:hypothetical protein
LGRRLACARDDNVNLKSPADEDGSIFGIWYARNLVVKTVGDQEVPKTPAT